MLAAHKSLPALAHPTVRMARPADIGSLCHFYACLSLRTRAQRFFSPLRELPRSMLRAIESRDPAHHFLVAEQGNAGGRLMGLGQYAVDAGRTGCEVALVIADEWQRCGLGTWLLGQLLNDAAFAGLCEARLETERSNLAMQVLARRVGFTIGRHAEDPLLLSGSRPLHSPALCTAGEP